MFTLLLAATIRGGEGEKVVVEVNSPSNGYHEIPVEQ